MGDTFMFIHKIIVSLISTTLAIEIKRKHHESALLEKINKAPTPTTSNITLESGDTSTSTTNKLSDGTTSTKTTTTLKNGVTYTTKTTSTLPNGNTSSITEYTYNNIVTRILKDTLQKTKLNPNC